jgi:carbon monoxide dehydrogenase subunit G
MYFAGRYPPVSFQQNKIIQGTRNMDMKGEQLIPATIEEVWAGINDTEVLQRCLPDCEVITRESAYVLNAKMAVKIGPVSAKFSGRVELADVKPPESCRLVFQGQGGPAGFARGEASVRLQPHEGGTLLQYAAQANVGGKLAQIGSRLVDATAKKLAEQFFANFKAVFAGRQAAVDPAPDSTAPAEIPVAPAGAPAVPAPASWIHSAMWFVAGALACYLVLSLR